MSLTFTPDLIDDDLDFEGMSDTDLAELIQDAQLALFEARTELDRRRVLATRPEALH